MNSRASCTIYSTLVMPVLTYGSQRGGQLRNQENRLHVAEASTVFGMFVGLPEKIKSKE